MTTNTPGGININDKESFPVLGSSRKRPQRKKNSKSNKEKQVSPNSPPRAFNLITDTSMVEKENGNQNGATVKSSPFSITPKFALDVIGPNDSVFASVINTSSNETKSEQDLTHKKTEKTNVVIANGSTDSAPMTWAEKTPQETTHTSNKKTNKQTKTLKEDPPKTSSSKKKVVDDQQQSLKEDIRQVREDELNMAQSQMRQLIEQKTSLESQLTEKDTQLVEKTKMIEQLQQQVSTIKDGSSMLQKQMDTFEAQLRQQPDKPDYSQVEQLENSVSHLKNQMIQLKTSSQDRETALINDLRNTKEKHQAEMDTLNKQVNKYSTLAESLQKELDSHHHSTTEAQDREAKLIHQLRDVNSAHQNEVENLTNSLKSYKSQIASLQSKLEDEKENAVYEKEKAATQIQQLKQENALQQSNLEKLTKENNTLRNNVEEKLKSETMTKSESFQIQINELMEEKRRLTNKVQSQMTATAKQQEQWSSKITNLQQSLVQAQAEAHQRVEKSKEDLKSTQDKLDDALAKIEILSSDKLLLENQIAKDKQEAASLKTSLKKSSGFPLKDDVLYTNHSQGFLLSYYLSNQNKQS
mmetsp:Transcript_9295/g.13764  ORF Transcript_9295/g.13764 Transcript_9295/m.13764 type:complete len:583 (-) Transcript_9295:712-2460(-)